MDIKWKNKFILAAWLLLFAFGLSGITLGLFGSGEFFRQDYFQTTRFQSQLSQFIDYLCAFELGYVLPEEAKQNIKVTKREIEEHRYRYGELTDQIANIKAQYESKIQNALINNDKETVDFYTAERDKKIEDIKNNFKSDEYVEAKIIKEKEERIDEAYRELENHRADFIKYKEAFRYHLKDTVTGSVYTNLNIDDGEKEDQFINNKDLLFIQRFPSAAGGYLVPQERSSLINLDFNEEASVFKSGHSFEGYIAVSKASAQANGMMLDYKDFQQKRNVFMIYMVLGLLVFLLSIYLYRKWSVGQLMEIKELRTYYSQIPIDAACLLFALTASLSLGFASRNDLYYYNYYEYWYTFAGNVLLDLIFAAGFVFLTFIQGRFIRERLKEKPNLKSLWQETLMFKLYEGLQQAFLKRSMGTQTLLLLAIVFASGLGATVVMMEPQAIVIYVPLFLLFPVPAIITLLKRIGYFNLIVKSADELAQGKLDSEVPLRGKSSLADLAKSLNALKQGVKLSQKEQAKSERLKTELITNVSHDLRTPLTSIINYTELLKTPDLSPEDREAYIQIIDRKSKRLKVLIDDLFEASKMASGNIDLVREKVDLVQLLQQAMAEHNETINQSTLQFRLTNPGRPVYAIVDGQKIWRVFDNLIVNILKYSLENTRVYISVNTTENQVIIQFKNVTKYELNENIDELFERFKRGDTSRHTEGSGLGLAIAKSIIDLHGGSMDISIDGDLFKITIVLEKAEI